MFSIFFLPQGNFDIDAGDGGGGRPFSTKDLKTFQNIINKQLFSIFFPPEGNIDIDARDGGEGNPNNPKNIHNKNEYTCMFFF